jgi:predicted dehydrogenase
LDYLFWLFGDPGEVVRTTRSVSTLDIAAVDYANYTLLYPAFTASVVLNYYRRDYKRTLELVFADSTVVVDLATNQVTGPDGRILFTDGTGIGETYRAQMEDFIRQVDTNSFQTNPLTAGLRVVQIATGDAYE